jgi:hypothetical protein
MPFVFIHEAAHATNASIIDHAYPHWRRFPVLLPEERRANASNYELLVMMATVPERVPEAIVVDTFKPGFSVEEKDSIRAALIEAEIALGLVTREYRKASTDLVIDRIFRGRMTLDEFGDRLSQLSRAFKCPLAIDRGDDLKVDFHKRTLTVNGSMLTSGSGHKAKLINAAIRSLPNMDGWEQEGLESLLIVLNVF